MNSHRPRNACSAWKCGAEASSLPPVSNSEGWTRGSIANPYGQAKAGGDVYYASSCATGRISRLLLADVSGHGNAVAATAADLRTLMRRFVNRLDQTEFVRLLNQQFMELSEGGTFATAIVSTFFAPSRRLTVCNAGHPRPLMYHAAQKRWDFLGHHSPGEAVNFHAQQHTAGDDRCLRV